MSMREWPWEHVQQMLRTYGIEIGTLAKRGDRLALRVRRRYQYAHDHPNDVNANMSLRDALDEYLQRDLRDAERNHLKSQFGHLIEPDTDKTSIFMPGSKEPQ